MIFSSALLFGMEGWTGRIYENAECEHGLRGRKSMSTKRNGLMLLSVFCL